MVVFGVLGGVGVNSVGLCGAGVDGGVLGGVGVNGAGLGGAGVSGISLNAFDLASISLNAVSASLNGVGLGVASVDGVGLGVASVDGVGLGGGSVDGVGLGSGALAHCSLGVLIPAPVMLTGVLRRLLPTTRSSGPLWHCCPCCLLSTIVLGGLLGMVDTEGYCYISSLSPLLSLSQLGMRNLVCCPPPFYSQGFIVTRLHFDPGRGSRAS